MRRQDRSYYDDHQEEEDVPQSITLMVVIVLIALSIAALLVWLGPRLYKH